MKVSTTGKECPYFYGDYHRGRQHEECRLLGNSNPPWNIKYCKTCPVPDIVRANACPHMVLSGEITKGFLGLNQKVKNQCVLQKISPGRRRSLRGLQRMSSNPEFIQTSLIKLISPAAKFFPDPLLRPCGPAGY